MHLTTKTLAAALVISTALSSAAMAATKVGVVGAINPEAKAIGEDGKARALKVGDEIFLNDQIETTAKGSAQLMFLDKSALTISPASAVKIDEFVYNPASGDGSMSLGSAKGAFRFIGGALTKKKEVKIKTPVSTIGIRGGIADTFVAEGGQTDAIMLFGDQMSMTNQDGVTITTNTPGSGLQITGQGGVPTQMSPQSVSQHISNSPVNNAANNSPNQSPNPTLDNSVGGISQGGGGGGGGGGAGGDAGGAGGSGAGGPGGSASDAGDTGTGNGTAGGTEATGGETSQTGLRNSVDNFVRSGGDADGDGAADFNIVGTDLSNPNNPNFINPNQGNPGGEGPGGEGPNGPNGPNGPTTNNPTGENPTGPTTNNPTNPTNPVVAGPGGGGGVPVNGAPSDTFSGSLLSGNEHAAMDTSTGHNSSKKLLSIATLRSGITDPDSDTINPDTTTFTVISSTEYETANPSNTVTSGTSSFAYDISLGGGMFTSEDLAVGYTREVTIAYDVTDGNGHTLTINRDIVLTGQDYLGGTTIWDTLPGSDMRALPSTPSLFGGYATRDVQTSVSGGDVYKGSIHAIDGTANGAARFNGKNVFTAHDIYLNGNTISGGNSPEYYSVGGLSKLSDGRQTLNHSGQRIENKDGAYNIQPGFSGFGVGTANGSFNYYQMQWDESSVVAGADQYFRGYLIDSPLYNAGDIADSGGNFVSDTFQDYYDMRMAYSQMVQSAKDYAIGTNGILEYDFLPEIKTDYYINTASCGGSHDCFGIIDYNLHAGIDSTDYTNIAAANTNGVFVDWNYMHFLGGYVDFKGAPSAYGMPVIRALFGAVNGANVAVSASSNTNGSGQDIVGGALSGAYYGLDQGADFANSGRSAGGMYVETQTVSSSLNPAAAPTNTPVEGMVFTGNVSNENVKQAAILGTGATASLLDNPLDGAAASYKGFTAGLITDSNNDTSRISSGSSAGNVLVNIATNGAAGADITYAEKDSVGAFHISNTSRNVDFGTFGSGHNAAIQKDLYAAEASGNTIGIGGWNTKGVIVAAHQALTTNSPSLVCNNCSFAHWGVWQADHIDTSTPMQKTAVVPYVAGQVTQNLTGMFGASPPVTYNGNAAANVKIDGTTYNVVGGMTADVDLYTRTIGASDLEINLSNIGNATGRNIYITNSSPVLINGTGDATFGTANISGTYTSGNDLVNAHNSGVADSFLDTDSLSSSGTINGALFGPAAQEIGGNFDAKGAGTETGSQVKVGGIFLGQR